MLESNVRSSAIGSFLLPETLIPRKIAMYNILVGCVRFKDTFFGVIISCWLLVADMLARFLVRS